MEDVLSWRRGTDGGGLIRLPPPSFVHSPACLSISQSLSIGDAIKRGLLARQINSLLAVADPLKLLPS